MKLYIYAPCRECSGQGVTIKHLADNEELECTNCQGSGVEKFIDHYDTKEEALEDYPEALEITLVDYDKLQRWT
jgi:predicted methyltransferase